LLQEDRKTKAQASASTAERTLMVLVGSLRARCDSLSALDIISNPVEDRLGHRLAPFVIQQLLAVAVVAQVAGFDQYGRHRTGPEYRQACAVEHSVRSSP